jgi:hypothetical protein
MCVALLCGGLYGAVGDLHNALDEFSSTDNPNGDWSYHVGHEWTYTPPEPDPPVTYPYDTICDVFEAGGWQSTEPGALYMRIGGGGPGDEPNKIGDPLGMHSPFMTRYTVADANALEVGLSYCQTWEPTRQMNCIIKKNGSDIASILSIQPTNNDGISYTWTQFFPGEGTQGFSFNVDPGDTIDFVVDPVPGSPGCTSAFTSWVREIQEVDTFLLTVNANPAFIDTTVPNGGPSEVTAGLVVITANPYYACQNGDDNEIWEFDSWDAPSGTAIGNVLYFTGSAGDNVTITANYVITSECGDACHPYPGYDYDQDCIVGLSDFAIFAATWLECTQPECIDTYVAP